MERGTSVTSRKMRRPPSVSANPTQRPTTQSSKGISTYWRRGARAATADSSVLSTGCGIAYTHPLGSGLRCDHLASLGAGAHDPRLSVTFVPDWVVIDNSTARLMVTATNAAIAPRIGSGKVGQVSAMARKVCIRSHQVAKPSATTRLQRGRNLSARARRARCLWRLAANMARVATYPGEGDQ